jgi:AsmA protein
MTRFMRYGVIPLGIFLVLLTVTAILVPTLVNVQRLVPAMENRLSAATGRSFSIGPDLSVSCFPWLSVSFSNLKIGNPPGFLTDDFVTIESFEGRISVLPLLWKKVEFSRFVVGGLSVNLEKNDAGQGNWQFDRAAQDGSGAVALPPSIGALSNRFSFDLFAVTDGRVDWHDRAANVRHRIEDVMVLAKNVTPGRPVALDFKAAVDGKPISLEGRVGPLQDHGGQATLPVDLDFSLVTLLQGKTQGQIAVAEGDAQPDFQLACQFAPFSPRAFFAALQLPFPLEVADPGTFTDFDLDLIVRGSGDGIVIDKGSARLDDSKLTFTLAAESLRQPKVTFSLKFDRLDLDRYRPLAMERRSDEAEKGITWPPVEVAGTVSLDHVKLHGATASDLTFPVHGKDGVFVADPAAMRLYGGRLDGAFTLNIQAEHPTLRMTVKGREIDAESLLKDIAGWEYLRGTVDAEFDLHWAGAGREAMDKTLAGRGMVLIRDGALLGVDLTGLATGDTEGNAGGAATKTARPETEFTEVKSGFTIGNGRLDSRETSFAGPSLYLRTSGTADLGSGRLNLRLEVDRAASLAGTAGPFRVTGILPQIELKPAGPDNTGFAAGIGGKADVEGLIARKLPYPVEDGGTNLVGRDLVDPEVVAQRFRLQRETIQRRETKKKLSIGRGRVKIGSFREEASLH